jgi:predicted GNAT family acetyltransferase
MATAPRVTDNPRASRYELWLGATRAGLIEYRSEPGVVVLVHTEVAPAFAGQGLGERLVAGALADLRARGRKLVPLCRFVGAYLRRHPDHDRPRPRRAAAGPRRPAPGHPPGATARDPSRPLRLRPDRYPAVV